MLGLTARPGPSQRRRQQGRDKRVEHKQRGGTTPMDFQSKGTLTRRAGAVKLPAISKKSLKKARTRAKHDANNASSSTAASSKMPRWDTKISKKSLKKNRVRAERDSKGNAESSKMEM